jgi:hypothetical protein
MAVVLEFVEDFGILGSDPVNDGSVGQRVTIEGDSFGEATGAEGEKNALGLLKFGGHDSGFKNFNSQAAANLEYHGAGHAGENAGGKRGRADGLILNPEQIAAGCFHDVPVGVQEQGFVRAGSVGFSAGEDLREFVAGFEMGERFVGGKANG